MKKLIVSRKMALFIMFRQEQRTHYLLFSTFAFLIFEPVKIIISCFSVHLYEITGQKK